MASRRLSSGAHSRDWLARNEGDGSSAPLRSNIVMGQLLLRLAVLVVLRNVGPEVVDLFLVLDAGEGHLGAGNFCLGVLDVFLELGLVQGDAGILVGFRVGIIRRGAGLAPPVPIEPRPAL